MRLELFMQINECRLIQLPQFLDSRGELTCAEYKNQIPFEIRRIYFITDIPKGAQRAGHAHKNLEQVIIPIVGSTFVRLFINATDSLNCVNILIYNFFKFYFFIYFYTYRLIKPRISV